MKDWRLDIGNSNKGHIGLVAYTRARTKEGALKKFRQDIPTEEDGNVMLARGLYYQALFINWNIITIKNIEEVER